MWTIDELVDQVRAALAGGYPGAPNGRVRDVPDRRAVRWYTTTGLVDRPATMRGRTALYGRRHLLQLVAVKRRQAQGRTLAEIQAELAGATDRTLADIAQVPDDLLAAAEQQAPAGTARPRFWAADRATTDPEAVPLSATRAPTAAHPVTAAPAATAGPQHTDRQHAGQPEAGRRPTGPQPAGAAAPLAGVALGDGVVLLLPGQPAAADLSAIAVVAGPLLDLLAARGLTTSTAQDPTTSAAPAASAHRPDDDPTHRHATRTERNPS